MNDAPGNGLVVRTAWLADSDVWVWEIFDARSGRVMESSWPSHWTGYDGRDVAQRAGVARLSELAGVSGTARAGSSAPSVPGRDGTSLIGPRQAGRSVLILVPRTRVDLYHALKRSFADDARAEVILDRRFRDRRVRTSPRDIERRREDRRRRTDIEAQLSGGGSVTVPVFPRAVNFLDPDVRAILSICCSQHVVSCQKCQNTYRLGWLPRTDSGLFSCPLCGFDVTPAVAAHTETCGYWAGRTGGRKPPTNSDNPRPPTSTVTG